uniref:BRO-N domain-containing protein n=1 Tax=Snodgrassella alvi TaxID=1196083 RepID=UPI003CC82073
MYSLILRSRKTEAKQFKKWVTSEVLPSIRKTGGYMTDVTLTRHQRTQIKRAVVLFIGQTGRTAQEVYKLLFARFGVQSYQDIPARHFDEAMSIIDKETQKGRPCILLDKTCNNNFLLHVKNGGVTVFVPSLNSYVVTKI